MINNIYCKYNLEDLKKELNKLLFYKFKLKIKLNNKNLKKTDLIKKNKKNIARIKMYICNKKKNEKY